MTLLKSRREELANASIAAAQQTSAGGTLTSNNNIQVLVNLQPGATAAAQAAAIAANNNDQASLDPIEMLISMNANGSLDEYYPALAIHLMMKTIKNSVSVEVRRDTIRALVFAMRSLDNRCVHYVELVIPPFLELMRSMNDNLVSDLITQLGYLVSFIKKHIEPYLNGILSFIEQYWSSNEKQMKTIVALIDLVKSIANVMDIEFKRYLPKILPLILKQLRIEINECTLNNYKKNDATEKIFNLLRLCTCCLENYVHLILSQFAEYLTINDHKELKQEIMFTIHTFARQITLSDNCAILFQSFIKILEKNATSLPSPVSQLTNSQTLFQSIQRRDSSANGGQQQPFQVPPVLSITYLLFSNSHASPSSLTGEELSASSNLGTLTIETLYLLARQMNGRFFVYAPMFDRILLKNKNYSRLYEQLLVYCREATYHSVWMNPSSTHNSIADVSTNSKFKHFRLIKFGLFYCKQDYSLKQMVFKVRINFNFYKINFIVSI